MKKRFFLAVALTFVAAGCCRKPDKTGCRASGEGCCQTENAVISTIMARRSIRAYLDTPVEHDPGFKNMFRNAPAVIAIAAPETRFSPIDCGLMAENMMLPGQGTCCLGRPRPVLLCGCRSPLLSSIIL